jgi:hypothetical protein
MADQVLVDAVPRIDLANLIEELKTKSRESLLEGRRSIPREASGRVMWEET